MKKIFVLFLLCLLLANSRLLSQPTTWIQRDSVIEITYHFKGIKPGQTYHVSVYASRDGGKTYIENPLALVTGDVGKGIRPGTNKKILWEVYKEIPDLEGIIVFDVRPVAEISDEKVKVIRDKTQKRFFIGYKGSFSFKSVTAPIGITAGFLGKPGIYLSGRLNPNYFIPSPYEIENGDPTSSGWIVPNPDDYKIKRFSVIIGIQPQVSKRLHIMTGIGFTQYHHIAQLLQDNTNKTGWAKDLDKSFTSYELEVGLMYQIGKMYIGAGITNYNKKYADITISTGVVF
jgi:hypothetical protein